MAADEVKRKDGCQAECLFILVAAAVAGPLYNTDLIIADGFVPGGKAGSPPGNTRAGGRSRSPAASTWDH
ncbi:MAG: hypothetical protein JNN26_19905 [Candidatus Obscuribacter sp.]|nr:hypothetical protein [Candidatus Obscuribacter sp.]